ncbi:MAG: hypothetical protein HYZ21_01080 [Chloroflexi bacterium]|nr:hypothetical protein [Chloroflexota bacterium]
MSNYILSGEYRSRAIFAVLFGGAIQPIELGKQAKGQAKKRYSQTEKNSTARKESIF